MPVYVFVGLYFLTTVAGNLAYLTPWGEDWPARSITGFSWSDFNISFGAAYWALLLMPIVIVPAVSLLVRLLVSPISERLAPMIVREMPPIPYTMMCLALYGYALGMLHSVDAVDNMISAGGAISAVQARFDTLEALGLWPQIVLMSPLVFLAIYAVVRAAREPGMFWRIAAPVNAILLSACLVLLNMKWPVVVFILLLGACVFVVGGQRKRVFKSVAILIIGVFVYLVISAVILRLGSPEETPSGTVPPAAVAQNTPTQPIDLDAGYAVDAISSAIQNAPMLAVVALNRMAMAAPYYYGRFTTQGPICGTIIDRIKRRPSPCQPSLYIYTEMFGKDGFEGIGTAPAAVNISGYALNGWIGAIVETVLGGIILGLFLALYKPGQSHPAIMAAFVMGAYAAYFMTQLPIEAAIVYPHGVLWWAALLLGWSAVSAASSLMAQRSAHQ